jgi:hypothetical protein
MAMSAVSMVLVLFTSNLTTRGHHSVPTSFAQAVGVASLGPAATFHRCSVRAAAGSASARYRCREIKTTTLEVLRDLYDRIGVGLVLIGMPDIEKRLARYPQLYSRVGFVHHYRAMSTDEQAFVLAKHWPELGLDDPDDYTTAEAVAAIARITSGNFRLTHRLVSQIKRILDINQLGTVTSELAEAARESLVIGA